MAVWEIRWWTGRLFTYFLCVCNFDLQNEQIDILKNTVNVGILLELCQTRKLTEAAVNSQCLVCQGTAVVDSTLFVSAFCLITNHI